MPLRDHFHPPLSNTSSWEGLHGGWPMVIVQQLRKQLPTGYIAEPRVHLGSRIEIDVGTFEKDENVSVLTTGGNGAVATPLWAPPTPSVAVETALPDYDEYEVRIYDAQRARHLVAAIEIVGPANKDRAEHRKLFVAKCAALIQKEVAVSLVDLVTSRHANLYIELMGFVGHRDPTLGTEPPPTYAASCRWFERGKRTVLEAWSYPLAVGQPLPTLPLWLTDRLVLPLNLEQSYEQACNDLWIS